MSCSRSSACWQRSSGNTALCACRPRRPETDFTVTARFTCVRSRFAETSLDGARQQAVANHAAILKRRIAGRPTSAVLFAASAAQNTTNAPIAPLGVLALVELARHCVARKLLLELWARQARVGVGNDRASAAQNAAAARSRAGAVRRPLGHVAGGAQQSHVGQLRVVGRSTSVGRRARHARSAVVWPASKIGARRSVACCRSSPIICLQSEFLFVC